jgi:hypothetical protein
MAEDKTPETPEEDRAEVVAHAIKTLLEQQGSSSNTDVIAPPGSCVSWASISITSV